MKTDVAIIGGGLSGLAFAEKLHEVGRDWALLEARSRLGGRIERLDVSIGGREGAFDLGPSWFWPGQDRMADLADRLGLEVFEQYATGALSFEDQNGRVGKDAGFAAMQGSLRLAGGMMAIIDALVDKLPEGQLRTSAPVARIEKSDRVRVFDAQGSLLVEADTVVLTVPPRIAAAIDYTPSIGPAALAALETIPTWMAGQAKAVAVFETPFWRDEGLSGDAMSRRGPMVEIHDASDPVSGLGALFGFIGVPPQQREEHRNVLEQACLQQFETIFGPKAAKPVQFHIKDWMLDEHTTVQRDIVELGRHPNGGLPNELNNVWEGALQFGSSELAPEFGGYLEGALAGADYLFERLN